MRRRRLYLVTIGALCGLTACHIGNILRNDAQERAFRERYVDKPFYTAMVLRPYPYQSGYLIDLSERFAEEEYETPHTSFTVPLGTLLTITGIDDKYILAHVAGYSEPFRILVVTKQGNLDEVAQELTPLLATEPPLPTVRPEVRDFVAQQQIVRGMSQREIYMSWGQPDKKLVLPSSASVLEEWIYFDRRIHLYLENGYITNWQQM